MVQYGVTQSQYSNLPEGFHNMAPPHRPTIFVIAICRAIPGTNIGATSTSTNTTTSSRILPSKLKPSDEFGSYTANVNYTATSTTSQKSKRTTSIPILGDG